MKILVADYDGTRARELSVQLEAQDDAFTVILAEDGENLLDAARRTGRGRTETGWIQSEA
jgi:hypothetical protein